jgi:WD40 repeat protein
LYLDIAKGAFVRELLQRVPREDRDTRIDSMEISEGNRLAYLSGVGVPAEIWDLTTGRRAGPLEQPVIDAAPLFLGGTMWTVDGELQSILRWDLETGQPRKVALERAEPSTVFVSRASPLGGSVLAATAQPKDGQLVQTNFWSLETGKRIRVANGLPGGFSRDGRLVLLQGVDVRVNAKQELVTSIVANVETGEKTFSFRQPPGATASLSPDGRRVALASGSSLQMIAVPGGDIDWTTTATDSITAVAFSPDRDEFAIATGLTVDVWAWPGPRRVRSTKLTQPVHELAFGARQLLCVMPSDDDYSDTVVTVDLETGATSKPLIPPGGSVYAAALSPDGRWLAIAGDEGITFHRDQQDASTLRLVVGEGDAWMVADAAGRYDSSSPDGSPLFHYVLGNQIVDTAQLKGRSHMGGLLGRVWKGERMPD